MASATENSLPVMTDAARRIRDKVGSVFRGDSLRAHVLRGVAWLTGGSVAEQAARFGRNLILTRLLAPEAFGEMAIVLSVHSVLVSFTDIGIREGIIQNPRGGEKDYVDVAWWMGFGRTASLAALLFTVAPLVAKFYGNFELTALLRLSTVALIFSGASSPRADVASKEMKFRKVAAISNIGGICGVLITVILTFVIRNVWALAIGFSAEWAARAILSYVFCPYVPSIRLNKEAARDLLRFSKGLFGLSFLNLIFARADIFVLAKLYPPATVGLYSMAIYLVQTPSNLIMNVLSQTFMPALSRIQGDERRTNRILIEVTSLIVLLGLPAVAFVLLCGRSLLTLTYGSRYGAFAGAMALASCVALVNTMNNQITTAFYARGFPHLHRRAVAAMAVAMAFAIYPLAKWLGPVGGQAACLSAVVIGYLLQVARVQRLTRLDLARYAEPFPIAVLVSLMVAAASFSARAFHVLARPITNVSLGIVGYLFACIMAWTILEKKQTRRSQPSMPGEL